MKRQKRLVLRHLMGGLGLVFLSASAGNAQITVNEIDYDQPSPPDDGMEFVELKGPGNMSLTGWSLVFYNGNGGAVYLTIDLSTVAGGVMPADGYLVVGRGVSNIDIMLPGATNQIQNGAPDGLALCNASGVVELNAYEGSFVAVGGCAAAMNLPDIGAGVEDNNASPNISLARCPDGSGGFQVTAIPTPGETNSCPATGACCDTMTFACDDGTPQAMCQGPNQQFTAGVFCFDLNPPCLPPSGACCTMGTMCEDGVAEVFCQGGNQVWTETFCANLIPPCEVVTPGACCKAGACTDEASQSACELAGGVFQGDNTMCNAPITCPATPFIIINELDSDTPGADTAEFVELYDGGAGSTSLDGLVIVFFNGDATSPPDSSYARFDLDGFSTDGSGYFVLGNAAVPGVNLTMTNGSLQNGADAVALYVGNSVNFPTGTPVTATGLIDAVVYDSADPDDAGLLAVLTPGQPQIDENANMNVQNQSIGRCPNGSGGALITTTYVARTSTPDGPNDCPSIPGACCIGGTCTDGLDLSTCVAAGGIFQGELSMCVNVTCPTPPSVIITEIMYNPNSDETAPNDVEWVEIYNNGGAPVDISGWRLKDDDGQTGGIPAVTMINAGEAVVLIPGPNLLPGGTFTGQTVVDFQAAWGLGYDLYPLDNWVFETATSGDGGLDGLANAPPEPLSLRDAAGLLVDVVNYDDDQDLPTDWPSDVPDGPSIYLFCGSLNRIANDNGLNWRRSLDGINSAVMNAATADFTGMDVGSPGVVLTVCEDTGGCCLADGTCTDTTEMLCENVFMGGYQGDNSFCETAMCPQPTGACCRTTGCTIEMELACTTTGGGVWQGPMTLCLPNPCPLFGACCTEGTCADGVAQTSCVNNGGVFQGDGAMCVNVTCPPTGELIISEVVEGTIFNLDAFGPSNAPRWVEITNVGCDPVNLAAYSVGNYNNGALVLGGGTAHQLAGILAAGDSHIFSYSVQPPLTPPILDVFFDVYGFQPDDFAGGGFINGDDVVALFLGLATGDGSNATIVDVYGVIGVMGIGQPWEYTNTYAGRNVEVVAGTPVFAIGEWTVGALDALVGADDAASTVLLQMLTNPGTHAFDDPCMMGCTSGAECNDLAVCTLDECDMNSCANTAIKYADVNFDTFVNVVDGLCLLDTFAGNPTSAACFDGGSGPPVSLDAKDIEPCPSMGDPNNMGNGFINVDDVLRVLDVFAGSTFACSVCNGQP